MLANRHGDITATSTRPPTELEQYAVATCGFLIPRGATITMLAFADLIAAYSSGERARVVVEGVKETAEIAY